MFIELHIYYFGEISLLSREQLKANVVSVLYSRECYSNFQPPPASNKLEGKTRFLFPRLYISENLHFMRYDIRLSLKISNKNGKRKFNI
jgi:hypothetical protein